MFVALGSEVKLVGAIDLGFTGVSLRRICQPTDLGRPVLLGNVKHTKLMTLVGAFLSPMKRRPLPVCDAHATLS